MKINGERYRIGKEKLMTFCTLAMFIAVQGMRQPRVMDIKIGARTYGPDANDKKIRQEDSKYLGTKKPLGKS